MPFLIVALLVYGGVSVDRLRPQHFASLFGFALVASLFSTAMRVSARNQLGEDGSILWQPQVFALGLAFTFALYCGAFCLGRAIGHWRKRRVP